MFGIDWRIASLLVMVFLGVYSVVLRKFFSQGEDWRVFLPLVALVGLVALAYFAYSFKEIKLTGNTIPYAAVIAVSIGLTTVLSMIAYADPKTELNIAVPVMSLAMVSTAALSILFLGEKIMPQTIAGIILALIAIVVLVWK